MFKPQLEALEDRLALSGNSSAPFTSYTFANGGTVLNIQGNNGSNFNSLFLFNTGDVEVNSNGNIFLVDAADFALLEQINIYMGKRNDFFQVQAEAGSTVIQNLNINAWLGSGNDTFHLFYDDSDFIDSVVNINVSGQNGRDDIRVYTRNSELFNSDVNVNFFGGNDNDYLFLRNSSFIDIDSELNYAAWGQNGNDVVRGSHTFFDGSEGFASSYVEGGKGKDNLRDEVQYDPFGTLTVFAEINANNEKDLITYTSGNNPNTLFPFVQLTNWFKSTLVQHPTFVL